MLLTDCSPISAMQTASKNLMETLSDIYEKEWVGQDMLYVQVAYKPNMRLNHKNHRISEVKSRLCDERNVSGSEQRDALGRPGAQAIRPSGHPPQHLPGSVSRDEGEFMDNRYL